MPLLMYVYIGIQVCRIGTYSRTLIPTLVGLHIRHKHKLQTGDKHNTTLNFHLKMQIWPKRALQKHINTKTQQYNYNSVCVCEGVGVCVLGTTTKHIQNISRPVTSGMRKSFIFFVDGTRFPVDISTSFFLLGCWNITHKMKLISPAFSSVTHQFVIVVIKFALNA